MKRLAIILFSILVANVAAADTSSEWQMSSYDEKSDTLYADLGGLDGGTSGVIGIHDVLGKSDILLAADLSTYGADPCFGIAQFWNSALGMTGHARQVALASALSSFATDNCWANISVTLGSTAYSFQPVGP